MNKLYLFVVISTCLLLDGCATSNYSVGRDFPVENVNKIVKGQTTAHDLIQLLGEPFLKTVVSANEEKWIYTYSRGTAHAQSCIVPMKVETTGKSKTLEILMQDGIAANFSYYEGGGSAFKMQNE
jgi:outer membrane biogenesis lipoprotein LolB